MSAINTGDIETPIIPESSIGYSPDPKQKTK